VDEQLKEEDALRVCSKKIIEVFLSSETMVDIILLFRSNPQLVDYGDRIASRIGRNHESVESDLEKLVKLGILNEEKIGKQTLFGFDAKRDREIQEIIRNYICTRADGMTENY
jgi:hypothetical protein